MTLKLFIVTATLLFLSSYSYSDVYKCRNADGHITYQSERCSSGDISSKVKITTDKVKIKKKRVYNKVTKTEPIGRWVSLRSSQLTATVAGYGGFEMTNVKGNTLKGTWQTADNNGYTVKAAFQGKAFLVNMRYDVSKDSLFLSKPGFPSDFEIYKRR